MTGYPAETVAVATVRGVKGVRVFCAGGMWRHVDVRGYYASFGSDITDVRPLVVLDLGDYSGERAVTYLRNIARDDLAYDGSKTPRSKLVDLIAGQIEAQAKPPRIPEPGKFAVVEAATSLTTRRLLWSRTSTSGRWVAIGADEHAVWEDLIDPTLVRERVPE